MSRSSQISIKKPIRFAIVTIFVTSLAYVSIFNIAEATEETIETKSADAAFSPSPSNDSQAQDATTALSPETSSAGGFSEESDAEIDGELADAKSVAQKTSYSVAEFAGLHVDDLPDGTYAFNAKARTDGVFDARSGGTSNGTAVQLYSSNQTDAQVWRVTHDENGFVIIANAKSGLVLDVTGGSSANGAGLQLYKANGSAAQKWIAVLDGDNFMLISALSGTVEVNNLGSVTTAKVADLAGASTANGTRLQLYSSNGTDAQRFSASAAQTARERLDALAAQYASEVADGTYAVVSEAGSRAVLDVSGGSEADGGNAQAWQSNASKAQRWVVSHDDAGYLTITNVGSGKALDVSDGSAQEGTNVQQWTSNGCRAQKWIAVPSASGGYELVSALEPSLTLDLAGGSTANGTNARIWSRNGSAAQRWEFANSDPEVAPCDRLESFEGTWLTLEPACAGGMVLDVAGGSLGAGGNVRTWTSNGTLAQLWQLEWANGYYRLYNANSGKCLDVDSGDCVPGTNAQQWDASTSNNNQLFAVTDNGDGTYSFVSKANGLTLNVSGGSTFSGTNVDLWTPDGTAAQSWSLSPANASIAEGTYTVSTSLASSLALDVAGGSKSSGANVRSYSSNGTLAQRWYVGSNSDGTYFLESLYSAMRLSADSDGNVSQRTANDSDISQRWTISAARGGYVIESAAYSGKVLDLAGASTASGANVQIYASNGTAAQRWELTSTSDQPSAGTYYVCAAGKTSEVLDVAGGSTSAGANVRLWSSNGTGAQKWEFKRNSNGTWTVVNCLSEKCLDVDNGSTAPGTNVKQWDSNGSSAQRWKLAYRPGGYRLVSALGPSLVLEAAGLSNGSNVRTGTDGEGSCQGFLLTATTYTPKYHGFQNPSQYFQVSNISVNIPHLGEGIFGYRTTSKIGLNATKQDCINAMINTAYEYMYASTPYKWDYACAPGVGVDCAGLVMQCLYATGMDLGSFTPYDHYYTPGHDHYANDMWNCSKFCHKSFSERQRGDLICYPGHIAIYIGNDQIIEAANPSVGIRISSVYSPGTIKGVLRPFV